MRIDPDVLVLAALTGLAIGSAIGLVVFVGWLAATNENKFMTACMQDGRKEYECTAMWRAGNRSSTVIPVFIPTR